LRFFPETARWKERELSHVIILTKARFKQGRKFTRKGKL